MLTAAWLHEHITLGDISTAMLRTKLWLLIVCSVRPDRRAAIADELGRRAWAAAVEARLSTTIAWCRGGLS